MEFAVVLALIAGVLAGWLLLQRRTPPAPARTEMPQHPYHCVALEARGDGCEAVRKLAGQRFLAAHAPHLPLADCESSRCECIYRHHEDRRHYNRRDPYVHAQRMQFIDAREDRRSASGRRKTDLMLHPMP
ncbi:hypothetical protein [Thauera sp. Sel9]|uniref:hypothetical protein n=1 Tax=Thauera sp. Sel9 TaxID=2974299 RepID=UPI0021E1A46A|nr:hypothetical protein [Thauera sp. Sel9]MCV2219287.1 hypothetical protein [Thauera sp. Sel9]